MFFSSFHPKLVFKVALRSNRTANLPRWQKTFSFAPSGKSQGKTSCCAGAGAWCQKSTCASKTLIALLMYPVLAVYIPREVFRSPTDINGSV